MALYINQGVQPKDEQRDYPIIVENGVKMVVDKISLCTFKTGAINVNFRILTGANKNMFVIDTVDFDPESKFSWKYRELRTAAKVPYTEGEPTQIDIEKLLIGRVVTADLSARAGKDKDGNPKDYQNIKYKKPEQTQYDPALAAGPGPAQAPAQAAQTDAPAFREISSDDDLPFKSAEETTAPDIKAKETVESEPARVVDVGDWD